MWPLPHRPYPFLPVIPSLFLGQAASMGKGQVETAENAKADVTPLAQIDRRIADSPGDRELYLLADRVEAFLVEGMPEATGRRIEGFPIRRNGGDLTPGRIQQLHEILQNPTVRDFSRAKKCPFLPSLAFVFHRGKETAHIILCLTCSEWNSGPAGTGHIDNLDGVRPPIAQLARELFPDEIPLPEMKKCNPTGSGIDRPTLPF